MAKMNRRTAITAAVAGSASIAATSGMASAQDDKPTPDENYVMEAGMTRDEANAWKKVAEAAAAFFKLPEQHPMDREEVSNAIHIIQNKLLSRPTYRTYLKLAKAGYEERKAKKEASKKKEE